MDSEQPRTSTTDSIDLSEGSSDCRTNHVEPSNSPSEDTFSQLKTKRTPKNKRARQPSNVRSESSDDDDEISKLESKKAIDCQYSSKDCRNNENLKKKLSNDQSSTEEKRSLSSGRGQSEESSDDTQIHQTKNAKTRAKVRTINTQSSEEAGPSGINKSPLKTNDSSSDNSSINEFSYCSRIQQTKNGKNRANTRKLKWQSSQEAGPSRMKKSPSKRSRSSDSSSTEEINDDSSILQTKKAKNQANARKLKLQSSQEAGPSKMKKSPPKRRVSNDTSSDETDNSPISRRRSKRNKNAIPPVYVESDNSQIISLSSEEPGSTQTEEYNSTQAENSGYTQSDEACSLSIEDYDSSQENESNKTPTKSNKKYKNLRVSSDTSDEDDEKENKLPIKSPKKINNLSLLKYKYKQLIPAVKYNNVKEVREIIVGKSADDLVLPEFTELLWQVVTRVKLNPEIASLLVRGGVDVNLSGPGEYSENSLLHVVAEKAQRNNYDQLAVLLMSCGADINKINGDGNSVLWSAVKGGSEQVVQELLRRKVRIDEQYKKVLRVATENCCNSAKILPLLIDYNDPDMATRDERALYALRYLVKTDNGDLTAMKVLLDCILPLNDIDDDGFTLLYRAVHDSKYEMVKLLLEYNADPRMKRRDGTRPLWCAARQSTSAIAGLLIKHGASVHDYNDNGQYPIHGACNALSVENIKLLLYFGAELDVTDNYLSLTPFSTINYQNMIECNKLIIQNLALMTSKNIKVNERDMKRVREYADMRKYYAQCLSELQKMKRLNIYKDISLYSILSCDINKVMHLIRNSELIDEYHNSQKKIKEISTVYLSAIKMRMRISWFRRETLISIENAIREASNNILTEDVCEKIANYACYDCFIDYDLKQMSIP